MVGFWANVDREDVDKGTAPLRVNVGDAIVRDPETGKILKLPANVGGEGANTKSRRGLINRG